MTSWTEAYIVRTNDDKTFTTECLYEDVSTGHGETLEESKEDFLHNIRLRIEELTEMLQFCSQKQPRQVK